MPSSSVKEATLSERLRNYRLSNRLSYAKLALLCRVSYAVVWKACNGLSINEVSAFAVEEFLRSVRA